jgi:glucosamine-6-phosphate deaminase
LRKTAAEIFVRLKMFKNPSLLAQAAAERAVVVIQRAITERDYCRVVLATGNSQLAFLDVLTKTPGIDWKKVEAFHLDEYVGMPMTHPASFRRFLLERVIRKTGIANYHLVEGDAADLRAAIREMGTQLTSAPIDLAFVGIGENGHIAFNDPPADFEIEDPYLVVELDEACRRQQAGEGWFADISEVPRRAISMSVRQIMKAQEIVCVVPDKRKSHAVKLCLEGEISNMAPASILRRHANATICLDRESASLLSPSTLGLLEKESELVLTS